MSEGELLKQSVEFSVDIIKYYRWLVYSKNEYIISKQLLRSSTSIGANIHEAYYGISFPDFINKMQIALKEAYETEYWLIILERVCLTTEQFPELKEKCISLKKMLIATLNTSKRKYGYKK